MNIGKIVLNNIKSLILKTELDFESKQILLKLKIEEYKKDDKNTSYLNIFFAYLIKKFDGDYKKINKYIINCYLKKYASKEIIEELVNENNTEYKKLTIVLEGNRTFTILIPNKIENQNLSELKEKYEKEVEYKKIKTLAKDKIEENLFDLYMNNNIDELIITESILRTGTELFENNTNKKQLFCFSKEIKTETNYDTLVLISEDFIKSNLENIDGFNFKDESVIIYFKNNKKFETNNKKLLSLLNNLINEAENILIDKKLKENNTKKKTLKNHNNKKDKTL